VGWFSDPYGDVTAWVGDVVERGKSFDVDVPYYQLLAVAMGTRVGEIGEELAAETMDSVEVAGAQAGEGRLSLRLRASTFVGTWYPVRLELRLPPQQCVMWFGAPDLNVDRHHIADMVWPTDDAAWPAIYRFRLDPPARQGARPQTDRQ
jgi:hypothetical protein